MPRAAFPEDAQLAVGQTFVGEDDSGAQVPVRVVEVKDDIIMVDANHPLAGETLYFHVDVREVRDATSEELAHWPRARPGRSRARIGSFARAASPRARSA